MHNKYTLFCSTVAIVAASGSCSASAENIRQSATANIFTLAGSNAPSKAEIGATQSPQPATPSLLNKETALPPVSAEPLRIPVTTSPSAPPPPSAPIPPPSIGPIPEAKPAPVITDKKAIKKSERARSIDIDDCFLSFNRYIRRNLTITTEERLRACDRELSIENKPTDLWNRRLQLLGRRAIHAYNLGVYQDAITAANTADSLAKDANDIFYNGSIAIANGMLRAASLSQLDKKQEAQAEIDRLRPMRPYAGVITAALDRISSSIDLNIDQRLERMAGSIKLQPDNARGLVSLYVWRGKFEQAIKIADQVSLVDPEQLNQFRAASIGDDAARSKNAELQMHVAYSLAALGKQDQAAAKIADVRRDVSDYLGSDPSLVNPLKPDKGDIRRYGERKAEAAEITKSVDAWEMGIKLRPKLASMTTQEALAALSPLKAMGLAWSELSRNIPIAKDSVGQQPPLNFALFDELFVRQALRLTPFELDGLVPAPEHVINVPKFGKFGSQFWGGGVNGYTQEKESGAIHDYRSISFGAVNGSPAMTDELGLLATAEFAQADGYDSFIILARKLIKRQTTIGGYGRQTYDSGHESRLRVVMINSNKIATEWLDKKHRLITVAEINQNLKPRYDQIFALKAKEEK